jgi:hypothetical protein
MIAPEEVEREGDDGLRECMHCGEMDPNFGENRSWEDIHYYEVLASNGKDVVLRCNKRLEE